MGLSREEVCKAVAQRLAAAAPTLSQTRALVGLDGFVDEIVAVVDKRYSDVAYDPVRTIGALAEKIKNAAGESSNYEIVTRRRKLGGNGPIMANALASLGLDVTYVGNLGFPVIDPVFDELATRARVVSIANPGYTHALEFDDGKIMLVKSTTMQDVSWTNLLARFGSDALRGSVDSADLIGLVNWTMLPQMNDIWRRLRDEVLPAVDARRRMLFIDLADPEKRTPDDIREAMDLLSRLQQRIDVILGLNLKEALEVAHVLAVSAGPDPEATLEVLAQEIRRSLEIACVVIHPRRGAAAATSTEHARFAGPFVQQPLISTGAGDHFNAGFCLGRVLGLGLEESLCVGVATSGYYVRNGISPSAAALADFVAELPPPQA
jgi:sugar/nucleoside kinase (ribokinase family)